MSYRLAYRLTGIQDPEERLEEAALFKAMCDYYGRDAVLAFTEAPPSDRDLPVFGRNPPPYVRSCNPVSAKLDYWEDDAFLRNAGRAFHVGTFAEARETCQSLQACGKSVFLKSARQKHFKLCLGPNDDFMADMADMAFSFMDGQLLLVQEFVKMEYEHRFFVIDRRVVTSSPNMQALTPLDFPLPAGTVYRTPSSPDPEVRPDVVRSLENLAARIAEDMDYPHACVDIAMIAGKPGVVEFNPMQLGHLGLFACDVQALAAASESLVMTYSPDVEPTSRPDLEETEFLDL